MLAISREPGISLDNVLKSIGYLNRVELDTFVSRVLAIRARRTAPTLSKNEADLLVKINRGLPDDIQQRYQYLNEKRQDETLIPAEHDELLSIIEQIERHDADRAEYLTQLAQYRRVPVKLLMKNLGINRPAYA